MTRLLAVLAAVVALSSSGEAFGCSCPRYSMAEKIDNAEFVGVLRVGTVELNALYFESLSDRGFSSDVEPLLAEYEPIEIMKGDVSTFTKLASGYPSGGCGMPLIPGTDYLVATTPRDDHLDVSYCSFNLELGPRSLVWEATGKKFWSVNEAIIDAVRSYVDDGMPIPECLDPTGFLLPDESREKAQRCRSQLEALEDAFNRKQAQGSP